MPGGGKPRLRGSLRADGWRALESPRPTHPYYWIFVFIYNLPKFRPALPFSPERDMVQEEFALFFNTTQT